MNAIYLGFIIGFFVLMTIGTGCLMWLHDQNEQLRRDIQIVEADRDAARRTINVLAAERAAAEARTRTAIAGKEAINAIPEGKPTGASETLLKSLEIANEVGGIK